MSDGVTNKLMVDPVTLKQVVESLLQSLGGMIITLGLFAVGAWYLVKLIKTYNAKFEKISDVLDTLDRFIARFFKDENGDFIDWRTASDQRIAVISDEMAKAVASITNYESALKDHGKHCLVDHCPKLQEITASQTNICNDLRKIADDFNGFLVGADLSRQDTSEKLTRMHERIDGVLKEQLLLLHSLLEAFNRNTQGGEDD